MPRDKGVNCAPAHVNPIRPNDITADTIRATVSIKAVHRLAARFPDTFVRSAVGTTTALRKGCAWESRTEATGLETATSGVTPYDATAARLPELIANVTLIPVEEGPDNIGWTHPDEVNTALLDFLAD